MGPPPFCRVITDAEAWYPTVVPLPAFVALPDDAHCLCGALPDKSVPKKIVDNAFIYSSFGAKKVRVEVQVCSKYPGTRTHYAGPDMRELGLFNFSNYSIFTHELLNSYTSRCFCHPAPFHAFCRTVRFDYQNHLSEHPFVNNDTFRKAWFSWMRIMQLFGTGSNQSQRCPICGPEPDVCIADAKTLGFQQQHLTSSLTPPTEALLGAPSRADVRPLPESAACVLGDARKKGQQLCRWRASLTKHGTSKVGNIEGEMSDVDAADVDADETGAAKQSKVRRDARDKVDKDNMAAMRQVIVALKKQSEVLGNLFDRYINTAWDQIKEAKRKAFFALLQQVRLLSFFLSSLYSYTFPGSRV